MTNLWEDEGLWWLISPRSHASVMLKNDMIFQRKVYFSSCWADSSGFAHLCTMGPGGESDWGSLLQPFPNSAIHAFESGYFLEIEMGAGNPIISQCLEFRWPIGFLICTSRWFPWIIVKNYVAKLSPKAAYHRHGRAAPLVRWDGLAVDLLFLYQNRSGALRQWQLAARPWPCLC